MEAEITYRIIKLAVITQFQNDVVKIGIQSVYTILLPPIL